MNPHDAHELDYWRRTDPSGHRIKHRLYLSAFGYSDEAESVLEIGTGPISGFLPLIKARRKVGIDPLYSEYELIGKFERHEGIEYVQVYFEQWRSAETFEAILSADALDHGVMGFDLLPKIEIHLKPGGRFYLHVHLRPKHLLNRGHDHQLTIADLDSNLKRTSFIEEKRTILPKDIDGAFCEALIGVWRKP